MNREADILHDLFQKGVIINDPGGDFHVATLPDGRQQVRLRNLPAKSTSAPAPVAQACPATLSFVASGIEVCTDFVSYPDGEFYAGYDISGDPNGAFTLIRDDDASAAIGCALLTAGGSLTVRYYDGDDNVVLTQTHSYILAALFFMDAWRILILADFAAELGVVFYSGALDSPYGSHDNVLTRCSASTTDIYFTDDLLVTSTTNRPPYPGVAAGHGGTIEVSP